MPVPFSLHAFKDVVLSDSSAGPKQVANTPSANQPTTEETDSIGCSQTTQKCDEISRGYE